MHKRTLLALCGLFAATPAFAATHDVDVSGSATYTSIQDAIDAATDGDYIRVAAGTYTESIDFDGKKLYIFSRAGSASTIIDGAGAASWAVTVSSGEPTGTTLEGFTLRNTGAGGIYVVSSDLALIDMVVEDLGSTSYYGPGLYASSATIEVSDSSFSGITGYAGGAAYLASSTVTFADTTFSDNWAYYGAAIYAATSDLTMTTVTLDGNENYYGSTIYAYNSVTLDATDLVSTANIANYGSGTTIYATTNCDVTLSGGEISDNLSTYAMSSGYYGALWVETNSTLAVTGTTFARNEGYGGAAATVYNYSSATFDGCTFEDHSAGAYGVLHVSTGSDLVVTNSSFSGNSSAGYGAAIYAASSVTLEVSDTTFDDNVATYYGGALYAYYYGDVTITDVSFTGNQATTGGAIYAQQLYDLLSLERVEFDGNEASGGSGGAVYAYYYTEFEATDCDFTDNLSSSGGGAVYAASLYSTAVVQDCAFSNNEAAAGGGGALVFYSATEAQVDNCSFDGNHGTAGGAIYAYYTLGTVAVTDSSFTDNESDGAGGAIYAYYLAELDVATSSFDDNVAYTDGGAIYGYYQATPIGVANSTFDGNRAEHGSGGAVYLYYDIDAELSGNRVSDNYAYTNGGGYYGAYSVNVVSENDTFERNTADHGSGGGVYHDGIYAGYGEAEFTDLTVVDNTAANSGGGLYLSYQSAASVDGLDARGNVADRDYGGGVYAYGNTDLAVAHATVCGNTADEGGGVYASYNTASAWTNTVLQENLANYGAGSSFVYEYGLEMTNNTVVGNDAAKDGGGFYLYGVHGAFTNNLVAFSQDGDGMVVDDSDSATSSTFTYNDWYSNAADDASGYVTTADLATMAGNLFVDPDLYDYTLDGDCTNDVLLPNGTSPLIDGGDPSILDPDGSVSDIGAYGGPGSEIEDDDGDGYASAIDCDDTDATINPGAAEVVGDGIDQDCDGADLTAADLDKDGDGHDTDAFAGGDDCDDADATVYPGAPEVWYDGTDQDCDGNDSDQDGDGWDVGQDCDDTDPRVSPDAAEVPYDGVDNDCDPDTTDTDVDGDGYDAAEVGGDDCDDADATINPDEEEIWYDDVDQDCSGGSDHDQDGDGHDAAASGGDDCNDLDGTKWTPEDCGIGGDTGDTGTDTGTDTGDDTGGGKDSGDTTAPGDCGCSANGGAVMAVPAILVAALATRRRRR